MSTRLNRYKNLRDNRLEGKYNGAPIFHNFPRFGEYFPVLAKGTQLMLLGGSGAGKSQLWIGFVLLSVYNLIKAHNFKARFLIYLLEDPIELFEDRLFCRVMYTKYGLDIDVLDLNSMKKNLLDEDTINKFKDVDAIVSDILSYCIVNDSIYNPTGIYKDVRTNSDKLGEHIWEERQFSYKKDDGTTYTKLVKVYKEYKPFDPEEQVFVILDNLNNLAEEIDYDTKTRTNIHQSITKWCRDYARLQLVKHWNWTVINIMQMSLEYDKKEFTTGGKNIIEKLEPTLNSLGDNKLVARDHHAVLALFAPHRFGITDYQGYDISKLKDQFRLLIVLKSNFSQSNIKIPLFFKGSSSYYAELPSVDKMDMQAYQKFSPK